MEVSTFLVLAEALTGTPVKEVTDADRESLRAILADDTRQIDRSQLNELLLLVNKDRMEQPFFDHFFGGNLQVVSLSAGVEKREVPENRAAPLRQFHLRLPQAGGHAVTRGHGKGAG